MTRLDIIWDEYVSDSSEADVRRRRGKGVRRCVKPSSALPANWSAFLRIDNNTSEFFSVLATKVVGINTNKHIVTTHHVKVLCNNQ